MTTEKQLVNRIGNIDMSQINPEDERDAKADELMSELLDYEHKLTKWEYDFLHSIIDWTTEPDKKHITFNQYETLLKIHSKRVT